MHGMQYQFDLFIVLVVTFAILVISLKSRVQVVVGLLVCGVAVGIVGPNGLDLLGNVEPIQFLAELGVATILLRIGIEFSVERLFKMWRFVLIGGLLQMVLTTLLGACAHRVLAAFGIVAVNWSQAFFLGTLMAMSSTIIVIRRLEEQGKIHTLPGRLCVGILIFQDLSLLPLALLTPALTQGDGVAWVLPLFKGVGIITGSLLLEAVLIRPLLDWVVRMKDEPLFNVTVALICLGTVIAASSAGLSPVLGMFLAGVLLSRTEYGHEVAGIAHPIRNLLQPAFFVSIGMLLDLRVLFGHFPMIAVIVLGLIVVKFVAAALTALVFGLQLKSAIRVGGALAQVGELSFVLAVTGVSLGILSPRDYSVFLTVAVISMALTPWIIGFALRGSEHAPEWTLVPYRVVDHSDEEQAVLVDHVVLVGYGVIGRIVAEGLRRNHVPFVVVEKDPDRRSLARDENCPKVIFGYANKGNVLEAACLLSAKVITLAIGNVELLKPTIAAIRKVRSDIPIIARVERLADARGLPKDPNLRVLPLETVGATEIATRTLMQVGKRPLRRHDVDDLAARMLQEDR